MKWFYLYGQIRLELMDEQREHSSALWVCLSLSFLRYPSLSLSSLMRSDNGTIHFAICTSRPNMMWQAKRCTIYRWSFEDVRLAIEVSLQVRVIYWRRGQFSRRYLFIGFKSWYWTRRQWVQPQAILVFSKFRLYKAFPSTFRLIHAKNAEKVSRTHEDWEWVETSAFGILLFAIQMVASSQTGPSAHSRNGTAVRLQQM